ncbi:hypothetical protein ACFQ3K_16075 [Brucella gallinifaecis]|uniref:DUF1127 domain-containing protein n=1 Tax=Brucella gallinifaecis TaxID=215590 RepID=A0A502BKY3_9HYPH|nr:hypothetical protein [Brucella gallinifaecis]TPF74620.1 hypothetical protein FHY56_12860 [Brucella gallinifaecis]
MIATSKSPATFLPATSALASMLQQIAKAVSVSILHRWKLLNSRRHIQHINTLDNYLLKDIGLKSEDLYTATHMRSAENPTRILADLAQARITAARHVC